MLAVPQSQPEPGRAPMICMWCKHRSREWAIEHIIPEGIGCQADFVLTEGQVCRNCNNGLGHVDQALLDSFDFPRFIANQTQKGNRPPAVLSRPNFKAYSSRPENEVLINAGRTPVKTRTGDVLSPPRGKRGEVRCEIEVHGGLATGRIRMEVGHHPKLSRAVHKVALESLSFFLGNEASWDDRYDAVRDYVRENKGSRLILLIFPHEWKYQHEVWPPWVDQDGNHAVLMQLCGIEFVVDLSPSQKYLPQLKDQLRAEHGDQGWTWAPLA